MPGSRRAGRRRFLLGGGAALGSSLAGLQAILHARRAPAAVAADSARPSASWGLQIGDVRADRAIVWSRADRPARMLVERSLDERMRNAVAVRGPHALDGSDFASRVDLAGLPADREVFVRTTYLDLDRGRARSEPVVGRLRTAPGPDAARNVRFVWGGDTAGQGWGINLEIGGMRLYETMRQLRPDFFIHCGDTIYADGPMVERPQTPDGSPWVNAFLDAVPEKRKVAETQLEFHRNYLYNLHDANVRRFNAEVPQIWLWDDHEVVNNWSDSKDLADDARYTEKRIDLLVARAARAFLDYAPLRRHGDEEPERVYRRLPWGDLVDVFVLDMRSYRGPNSANLQPAPGPATAFLGPAQIDWLKRELAASRAMWKVLAADMPLGLQVMDGEDRWEAVANGDPGGALGRELEIADLLRFIKQRGIANLVWITADVHYCAAHHYHPERAAFQDFAPFWEFVAGPLNAGTFGPARLDATFGPQVVFEKTPAAGQANLPPSAGLQFFGQVDIDGSSRELTVTLKDSDGNALFGRRLSGRGASD